MALTCTCPQCNASFDLSADLAGKVVRCAKCEGTFTAPEASATGIQTEPAPLKAAAPPRRWESGPRRDAAERSGMSGGMIALLVVLAVGGVGLLGVAALFCLMFAGAGFFVAGAARHAEMDHEVMVAEKMQVDNMVAGPKGVRDPDDFPPDGPPAKAGPDVPPFQPAPNVFKAATQTRLREMRKLKAPGVALQMRYSPKHELLFVRNSANTVTVIDVKNSQPISTQPAAQSFTDMALAPDQSALFAAEYGGTNIGYGTPAKPSHVHRYDLTTRTWEKRQAPKIAYRIEAVDSGRFLLQEHDQWVGITLNQWEQNANIRELARIAKGFYHGDFEYDPRTGRIYHGTSGSSSQEIIVSRVVQNSLHDAASTGTYGSADKGGGGGATLSADGSRFYYGKLQVDALNVKNNLRVFPEVITAASRDLAFGKNAYYDAKTGKQAGTLGFANPVVSVSADSMFVWAFDPTTTFMHQFAIDGER